MTFNCDICGLDRDSLEMVSIPRLEMRLCLRCDAAISDMTKLPPVNLIKVDFTYLEKAS